MYHIIELFEDGNKSAAIIPDEWLVPGSTNKYFWPSSNADSTWVKNRKKPGLNWNIFTYQRIIKSTSTYQKSVSLLQKAEEKSDLSSSCLSDTCDCGVQKRKPVPRRIWSPSYESADGSTSPVCTTPAFTSSLPNVSCTITNSKKRARSRSPQLPAVPSAPPRPVRLVIPQTPSPVRRVWSSESTAQLGPFTVIDRATITHSESTPTASSAAATDRATTRRSILASSASSAPSATDWGSIALIVQMLPSFFEKSFKKFEETQASIEILQRKVDRLEAMHGYNNVAVSQTTPALPDGFILPLQEVGQLEQLNNTLAEEGTRQRMILYLSNYGGKTPKDALYRLLRHLLQPRLSILYSMEGRKGKLRFNSLKHLKDTIYEAIRKKYSDATVANLDKYSGEWLAISGDRDGGRKRREEEKKRKLQSVENTSL